MGSRILKISKYKPSIFQGSLKLSSRRAGISLTVEHPAERFIRQGLFVTLVVLICAYGYFVTASILNVIARKEAIAQSASLESTVALLERDYYALAAAVKPDQGARLGLAPVSDTKYVRRPGTVGALDSQPNEL